MLLAVRLPGKRRLVADPDEAKDPLSGTELYT
jgi:hypothetical protein